MPNEFCDCPQDGYCPRYGREMTGRFREICAGINCDLGTAAVFREQWRRDYETIHKFESPPSINRIPLLLKTDQCVGDAVVMTAAIYSLATAHPGRYDIAVQSRFPEVFAHNPDVSYHADISDHPLNTHLVQMHYPAIHNSNERGIHFMQAYCEFLGKALGVQVPLLTNRPHLYFDHWVEPNVGDYWIVCSGGKKDFTNKLWGHLNYQKVVSMLAKDVHFIQVGANFDDHPYLRGTNVRDMIGCTNLRQLFELVRRCRGVLCGVSLLMHVAAALGKPCVVVAGGREPVQWNAYPNQQYLHTVGATQCTDPQGRAGACWRSRTIPLGDGTPFDQDLCQIPLDDSPACMGLIKPKTVADLILMYDKQYNQ